jgi:hypothetical protein
VTAATSNRAVLLYRDTCPKCRVLSRLAVLLSFNTIERIPLGSPRAAQITGLPSELRRKLTLICRNGRSATGWHVVPTALRCTVQTWFTRNVPR